MGPILAAILSKALVKLVGATLFQLAMVVGVYPIALVYVNKVGGGALFNKVILEGIPAAVD